MYRYAGGRQSRRRRGCCRGQSGGRGGDFPVYSAASSSAVDSLSRQFGEVNVEEAAPKQPKRILVTLSCFPNPKGFHTAIYAVELDSQGDEKQSMPSLEPIIVLGDDFPSDMALIFQNQTLFMFGGFHVGPNTWDSGMFSYPLSHSISSANSSTTYLKKHDCKKNFMASAKKHPRAVLLGEKVCVFSARPRYSTAPNFEVYNTNTSSWFSVFGPFDVETKSLYDNKIYDWAFKGDSGIYLATTSGCFFIDISSDNPIWQPHSMRIPLCGGWIFDNYLIDSVNVLDLNVPYGKYGKHMYIFPSTARDLLVADDAVASLVFMGRGKLGQYKFCTVRAGFRDDDGGEMVPHLLFDKFQVFTSTSREFNVVKKQAYSFLLTKNSCTSLEWLEAFLLG